MTFSPYLAHTDPLFKGLKILPVNNLYIDRIGIIMFKATYDLLPKSITQLFSKNKDIHYIINSVNRKNPSPCPCIIKKILSPPTPVPNFMCKEQLLKLFFIPTVYNVLYP